KRAYCLKTQPATGETYPKSDLFNKAIARLWRKQHDTGTGTVFSGSTGYVVFFDSSVSAHCYLQCGWRCECTGCAA
ncbi:hypothetical protein ACJEI3_23235, partial [Escherichia coli]